MPKNTRAQHKVDKSTTKSATLPANNENSVSTSKIEDDNNNNNGVSDNAETRKVVEQNVSGSIVIPSPKQLTNRRTKSPITNNKRPTPTSLSRSTSATASRPTSNKATRRGANSKRHVKSKGAAQTQTVLEPPDNAELLACTELDKLQAHLRHISDAIKEKSNTKQRKVQELMEKAVLPFQQRRAQNEAAEMEPIINQYQHNLKRISVMEEQLVDYKVLRDRIFSETRHNLETEIEQLEAEKKETEPAIRAGYIDRINLLQRYWPWRRLHDLGDTKVGKTFAEELARGPRFRNVSIQNNIESEYIEKQIKWLEGYVNREAVFRQRLRTLDNLVEDLSDVNELLESALTCSVCGLLYEDPVIFWPCGHTFCLECFHSLAIAPSLYRCSVCGSIGSEGYVHNLLIADTVAKWMFKDSGYRDVDGPLNAIRTHMMRFQKQNLVSRLQMLREIRLENLQRIAADPSQNSITFLDRPYETRCDQNTYE